jgi:hypothetical protein
VQKGNTNGVLLGLHAGAAFSACCNCVQNTWGSNDGTLQATKGQTELRLWSPVVGMCGVMCYKGEECKGGECRGEVVMSLL